MTSPGGGGDGGHMDLTPLWLPLAIETRGVNKQLEQLGGRSGGGFSQAFQRATGKGMSRGIEQASRQVGASMTTLAAHTRTYEQASRKAADATGKHRVAQLALKKVQADSKATALQLAQAEEKEAKAKRDAKAATDTLKTSEHQLRQEHKQLQQDVGRSRGAFGSFFAGLRSGHREAIQDIDGMGKGLTGASVKGTAAGVAIGTAITGGVRLASQGIAGMVRLADDAFQKAYRLGEQWDTVSDQIKVFTTTTGTAYEQLNRNAERVAARLPGSLNNLGQNIGVVHSRLGLTGKDLEDFTRQAMEAGRMLGQELDLRKLTGSMKAFGIEGSESTQVLNDMFNIARRTGVPINDLISATQKGSVFLKRYGLGFSESAALLAQFDVVGVDTSRLVKSLGKAMEEFAEQGKDPATGLKDTLATVEELIAAGRNTDAVTGLQKLFGAGAGTQIFSLIETGALSLDSLQDGFVATGDSIDDMAAKTDDVPEKIGRMVNRVKVAARPLAEGLFGALGPQLDRGLDGLERNQDTLIQGFVTVGQYALGFGETMARMGVGVLRVWSLLSAAGSRTVGTMIKALSSFAGYAGGFLDIIGLDTMGKALKDLGQSGSETMNAFDKLPDTLTSAADALEKGFINKVPGWQEGLQDFGDDVIENTKLSKALGDNIISGIPDTKEIRIEGDAKAVTDEFRKLGVEIETTPDGKIISVQAPTEEAAQNVRDFIKRETGQELDVRVKAVNPQGRPIRGLKDFLPSIFGGNIPPVNVPTNIFTPPGAGTPGVQVGGPTPPGFPAPAGAPGGAASGSNALQDLLGGGGAGGGRGALLNLQMAGQSAAGGGNAESWRPYVRQALAAYGPGLGISNMQAWEDALVKQIGTESGGNPGSVNENDSNGQGGRQRVAGLLNFLDTTYAAHNITGLPYMDPMGQIAAALHYVMDRWGVNPDGSPKQIGQGQGFADGRVPVSPHGPRQPAPNTTYWQNETRTSQWGPFSPLARLVDLIRGKDPDYEFPGHARGKVGIPGFQQGFGAPSPFDAPTEEIDARWLALWWAHQQGHTSTAIPITGRAKGLVGFDSGKVPVSPHGPRQPGGPNTDFWKYDDRHSQWGPWASIARLLDNVRGIPYWEGVPGRAAGSLGMGRVDSSGVIRGPGTGTSDSILGLMGNEPIRVSNEESIVTAAATRANAGWIRAMNKGAVLPKLPGYSMGVTPEIEAAEQIAAGYGLKLISGKRDNAMTASGKSYHLSGQAGDFSNGSGNTPEMLAFAQAMAAQFGSNLAELIYSAPGWTGNILDGKPHEYSQSTLADHENHVHVAIKPGGNGAVALGNGTLGATNGFAIPAAGGLFGNPALGGPMTAEQATQLAEEQQARADAVLGAERSSRNANEAVADAIYARDEALRALEEARAGGTDDFGNPTPADPEQVRQLERQLEQANRSVRDATENATDAEKGLAQARTDATKPSEVLADQQKETGRPDSNAAALGGGLVSGALEALGFDGSVFGDPTQWGIWKLFTGGVNYAGNLAKNFAESRGGGSGLGTGGAGGGDGGSAPFGLLSGLLGGAGLPGVSAPSLVTQGPGLAVPSAVSATAQPGSAVAPAGTPASGIGSGPLPGAGTWVDQSVTIRGNVGQSEADVGAAIEKGRQAVNRQPNVGFPGGAPHP